ncbi:MAG TPA: hypothetical protein VH186_03685 [Chloroflexia bacterium]|nr:hypothetical protein [Chloroflexia bacterium]
MERMSVQPNPEQLSRVVPQVNSQTVEGLLGANAARHIFYLLDGQYLYQTQSEDGSIRYKFLSAQSVRLAFSQEPVDSGWLPPQMCRWGYGQGGQWAVMFVPPAKHSLWMPSITLPSGRGEPQIGETPPGKGENELAAVEVSLPGLVFAGAGSNYYLWAIKDSKFTPQAGAYHVPLPNVYPDGRICWGSNRVEPATTQNLPVAWKLFISSPFNRHLVAGKSKRYPENVLNGLGQIASTGGRGKQKHFPLRDLVPFKNNWEREGLTICGLVERLIKSANGKAGF